MFTSARIRILRSPVRAPRANAIMERWIGGCRRELLDRTLIWNQGHLFRLLREYETHHNEHRPHRSLQQACGCRKPRPPSDHYPVLNDAFDELMSVDPEIIKVGHRVR